MLDNSRQYELLIRPLGRATADEYYYNSAIWIEGREGNTYTIDIRNNSYRKMMFVVSVDGLDVLDGKPAGLDSRGYVVEEHSSINIPGWVLDKQQAADFFFSRSRDTYVNSIGGSAANTGVIGVMVFSEKLDVSWGSLYISHPEMVNLYPNWSGSLLSNTGINNLQASQLTSSVYGSSIANAASSVVDSVRSVNCVSSTICKNTTSSPVSQDIGTGFGEAHEWKTVDVNFVKANPQAPDCMLAIYYNTAKNLEKMGISLRRKNNPSYKANPFPAYSSPSTGCKPPSNWNG